MTFHPRLGALPPAQRALWPTLKPVQETGFALYGGTAIALRLEHRFSVDFDFFSDKPLQREQLQARLPFLKESTAIQVGANTWSLLTPEHVKVSFFGGILFGRVGQPERSSDDVIVAASLLDLLALKLAVILERVEAKDYLDIDALLSSGLRLEAGLAGALALYPNAFQPSECLKALTYFVGGDLECLSRDLRQRLVEAVRNVRKLPDVTVVSRSLV